MNLIPGLGRSPGEGHGNLLQYSCLENPINRGTWRATVHSVAKSQTGLKQLSIHTHSGKPDTHILGLYFISTDSESVQESVFLKLRFINLQHYISLFV